MTALAFALIQVVALCLAVRAAMADGLSPGTEFRDCDDCPIMIVVPAGRYVMGGRAHDERVRPAELPRRDVHIAYDFAVSKYEVGIAEFERCQADAACSSDISFEARAPEQAAFGLSWLDAQDYVRWLSEQTGARYRLLSDAEWEYAARAGTDTIFWWGDDKGEGHAACSDCGRRYAGLSDPPRQRGQYPANPFGLHDTSGGVAEWVEDCIDTFIHPEVADGSPVLASDKYGCDYRAIRGGDAGLHSLFARNSDRTGQKTDYRLLKTGIRLARDLGPLTRTGDGGEHDGSD